MTVLKRYTGSAWEVVGVPQSGSTAPTIKRRVRDSLGDITTTSTTMTPIDATNLAYVTFDLAVGDMVDMSLGLLVANAVVDYYVGFDFEVDRPTSGNVYASGGQENGVILIIQMVGGYRPQPVTALGTFVATEAGTHGFRPVWRVEGNTGKIFNGTSAPLDLLVTFVARHWPVALVG